MSVFSQDNQRLEIEVHGKLLKALKSRIRHEERPISPEEAKKIVLGVLEKHGVNEIKDDKRKKRILEDTISTTSRMLLDNMIRSKLHEHDPENMKSALESIYRSSVVLKDNKKPTVSTRFSAYVQYVLSRKGQNHLSEAEKSLLNILNNGGTVEEALAHKVMNGSKPLTPEQAKELSYLDKFYQETLGTNCFGIGCLPTKKPKKGYINKEAEAYAKYLEYVIARLDKDAESRKYSEKLLEALKNGKTVEEAKGLGQEQKGNPFTKPYNIWPSFGESLCPASESFTGNHSTVSNVQNTIRKANDALQNLESNKKESKTGDQ